MKHAPVCLIGLCLISLSCAVTPEAEQGVPSSRPAEEGAVARLRRFVDKEGSLDCGIMAMSGDAWQQIAQTDFSHPWAPCGALCSDKARDEQGQAVGVDLCFITIYGSDANLTIAYGDYGFCLVVAPRRWYFQNPELEAALRTVLEGDERYWKGHASFVLRSALLCRAGEMGRDDAKHDAEAEEWQESRVAPERDRFRPAKEPSEEEVLAKILAIKDPKDLNNPVNDADQTWLHVAAYNGYAEAAGLLLLRGAQVDVQDATGRTPLHWAARESPDIVGMLLLAGANVEARDDGRRTPLGEAADGPAGRLSARLLVAAGAEVNVQDANHQTPLMVAMNRRKCLLADFLCECGAKWDINDFGKKTALGSATKYSRPPCTQSSTQPSPAAPSTKPATGAAD
jgi:hypothetical protein